MKSSHLSIFFTQEILGAVPWMRVGAITRTGEHCLVGLLGHQAVEDGLDGLAGVVVMALDKVVSG